MPREYIEIGSSPTEENCAQVGTPAYPEQSRLECNAFVGQLRRVFGPEPEGAQLAVKSFPHDFGTYREVVVYYDDTFPESVDFAFKLESESPATWDDAARKELGL